MANRLKCVDKFWNDGAPARMIMMLVALLAATIIITGVGLRSSIVWLILTGVSVLCLVLCSCMKFRKKTLARRAGRDTVSTISESNDNFLHMIYPEQAFDEAAFVRRDSPPSYNAATSVPPPYAEVTMPPDYNTVVAKNVSQPIFHLDIPHDNSTC